MVKVIAYFFAFISVLLTSALFSACSTIEVDQNDPASLYLEAESEIENDRLQLAIEKLRSLKNKFPYSKYAVDAQLKIADVYFLQDSFAEAASAYETFHDLHPKHEKAAYAMFRVGKSYLKDTPSNISRDLAAATKGLKAYHEFLNQYPTALETVEAKNDIQELRNKLAEKEYYIGNFYFTRGFYDSAKPRFQKVVELYSDTPASKKAKEGLEKIEQKNGT